MNTINSLLKHQHLLQRIKIFKNTVFIYTFISLLEFLIMLNEHIQCGFFGIYSNGVHKIYPIILKEWALNKKPPISYLRYSIFIWQNKNQFHVRKRKLAMPP